jgi:hypothetical protein
LVEEVKIIIPGRRHGASQARVNALPPTSPESMTTIGAMEASFGVVDRGACFARPQ